MEINLLLRKIAQNISLSRLEYVVAGTKKHLPAEDVKELKKDYESLKQQLLEKVKELP